MATPDDTSHFAADGGSASTRRVPTRLAGRLLLVASAAAGTASATATLLLSGALDDADRAPSLVASTALVGIVGALWFAGLVLSAILVLSDARPTRIQGWLAAFGLAPFAVALFFFVVAVGVTGGVPGGYVVVACILLLALFARRLLRAISEKLLIAFFLWLALLVIPVIWSDPVNETFSIFLLRLLRVSGVIV